MLPSYSVIRENDRIYYSATPATFRSIFFLLFILFLRPVFLSFPSLFSLSISSTEASEACGILTRPLPSVQFNFGSRLNS